MSPGNARPLKSVDKALTPVICRARTVVVGAGRATAHLGGGWMVRKDASLPVIGLMIVLIVFSGRSLVQAANRQQAGAAKQTAQRVLSLAAQAVRPSEALPLSLMEGIALALERNFDIMIEGFNPKIRAPTSSMSRPNSIQQPSQASDYIGGKEQVAGAPSRWPPRRDGKVRTATPLAGVEQRFQFGTRLGLQVSQQHIGSNETGSSSRVINPLMSCEPV